MSKMLSNSTACHRGIIHERINAADFTVLFQETATATPTFSDDHPDQSAATTLEARSPVMTWILGFLWSLPWGVSPRLEWGPARALSSRAVAAVHASLRWDQGICVFPSKLSHEAFPRGFPTGLSHVPPWCESILGLKVEAVQGKQVSLEWTETSGGIW